MLCRVCDCAILNEDTEYVQMYGENAILRVRCEAGGHVYLALSNGDVFVPPLGVSQRNTSPDDKSVRG